MQDMDTLAPDDTNELEVVFISTPNSHSLQVHSEDFLLSKGGSAPVELDDTASEDKEQDHGDPELPLTIDHFQQIKVHVAFANVSMDIRMKEKMKGKLPVERFPKKLDGKWKEKLKKGKQST